MRLLGGASFLRLLDDDEPTAPSRRDTRSRQ